MKLFIKILLFVFVTLVTNVKVASASISFANIQKATTFYSFHRELPEIDFKVIKNDEANCSQNEQNLVDYRDWDVGVELVAAKGSSVFSYITPNITKQMAGRGWTIELIHNTVNNPFTTRHATNEASGTVATAYFQKNGSYIVKDNVTKQVIPQWL